MVRVAGSDVGWIALGVSCLGQDELIQMANSYTNMPSTIVPRTRAFRTGASPSSLRHLTPGRPPTCHIVRSQLAIHRKYRVKQGVDILKWNLQPPSKRLHRLLQGIPTL